MKSGNFYKICIICERRCGRTWAMTPLLGACNGHADKTQERLWFRNREGWGPGTPRAQRWRESWAGCCLQVGWLEGKESRLLGGEGRWGRVRPANEVANAAQKPAALSPAAASSHFQGAFQGVFMSRAEQENIHWAAWALLRRGTEPCQGTSQRDWRNLQVCLQGRNAFPCSWKGEISECKLFLMKSSQLWFS